MPEVRRLRAQQLESFCKAALEGLNVNSVDAARVADCLVSANLHGVDTHGIARLPVYMRRLTQSAIKAAAHPHVVAGRGATAVIDGDNALGPVAAHAGMAQAIARARDHGVSYVSVRNSNHFSYAAYYCEQAAAEGMIGLCSSSGEPTVAPWGGTAPFFTNSPLALAAPTSDEPIVIDLATSVSSRGNILLADTLGQSIPGDWAIDKNGEATTDAAAALAGSVLPLGGAKGYALIVALEILNSVLADGLMAPNVGSQSAHDGRAAGVSHFFIAIDPSAMMNYDAYIARIDKLVSDTRCAPARDASDPIRLPGDRRRATARERRANGIPVPQKIISELEAAADRYSPRAKGLL